MAGSTRPKAVWGFPSTIQPAEKNGETPMKKAAVTLATLYLLAVLATANAKTYSVELFEPSVVAGHELKAGLSDAATAAGQTVR